MNVPDVSPELPPMHWRAALRLMRVMPQGMLSRAFGGIADVPLPLGARQTVIGTFAKMMNIDASEAEKPITAYHSINEFFVRRLRTGARSIDPDPSHVVSPVDGVVGQTGRIDAGKLIQAKGRTYTAAGILDDQDEAQRFHNGSFATIYLSPRHYHRIHSPADGVIARADHLPGALFPVNAAGVAHVQDLFPRNERLVCYIDGAPSVGRVAVVAVGAYNVGRISAAFDPAWRDGNHITNRAGAKRETRRYDAPPAIARGEEIMAFHLGSTVVMLFERVLAFDPRAESGREIRMGATLAQYSAGSSASV